MEKDFSFDALISFLDKAAERGDVKLATANALKASCNKVFSILNDNEKGNLSTINIDKTFDRFKNLGSDDLSPDSLKTYRSRVNKAVSEFLKFREDAEHWKPSFSQRAKRPKQNSNGNDQSRDSNSGSTREFVRQKEDEPNTLSHNYPLRDNCIVTISGLPRDLKSAEAKRLAAFLQALCGDFEPGA